MLNPTPEEIRRVTTCIPSCLIERLDVQLTKLREKHPHLRGLNRSNVIREGIANWVDLQEAVEAFFVTDNPEEFFAEIANDFGSTLKGMAAIELSLRESGDEQGGAEIAEMIKKGERIQKIIARTTTGLRCP